MTPNEVHFFSMFLCIVGALCVQLLSIYLLGLYWCTVLNSCLYYIYCNFYVIPIHVSLCLIPILHFYSSEDHPSMSTSMSTSTSRSMSMVPPLLKFIRITLITTMPMIAFLYFFFLLIFIYIRALGWSVCQIMI